MIPIDYIKSFKETHTYQLINDGILNGDIQRVLLGNTPYGITSQNEPNRTIPSQIIIGLHILITENKTDNYSINNALKSIPITEKTICILLDYIDTYLTYKIGENILKLDFKDLLSSVEIQRYKFNQQKCVSHLLASIESKITG